MQDKHIMKITGDREVEVELCFFCVGVSDYCSRQACPHYKDDFSGNQCMGFARSADDVERLYKLLGIS